MALSRRQKAACKQFADDVVTSLSKYTNVGLSAFNYGLTITDGVMVELRRLLPPGISVQDTGGFMGYLHFQRTAAWTAPC